MIERIARALAEICDEGEWEACGCQAQYREMASAAITAMREPTDAMVEAAYGRGYREVAAVWRAMIDAALTCVQPPP